MHNFHSCLKLIWMFIINFSQFTKLWWQVSKLFVNVHFIFLWQYICDYSTFILVITVKSCDTVAWNEIPKLIYCINELLNEAT